TAVLGAIAPAARWRTRALVLAGLYGLLRVFAPPGYGAEAAYVAIFAVAALALARGDDTTALGVVQLVALGAVGVLLGDTILDEDHAAALRGVQLPLVVAALAWTPLALDRLAGLVVRRTGVRAGVELAAGLAVLVATAHPLATTPLVEDVVT